MHSHKNPAFSGVAQGLIYFEIAFQVGIIWSSQLRFDSLHHISYMFIPIRLRSSGLDLNHQKFHLRRHDRSGLLSFFVAAGLWPFQFAKSEVHLRVSSFRRHPKHIVGQFFAHRTRLQLSQARFDPQPVGDSLGKPPEPARNDK